MIKASLLIVASAGLISLVSAFKLAGSSERNVGQQENTSPVIKIISPTSNSTIARGVQVRFEITVSDKEDGESKYDEINTKEVLLQVKYVSDSLKLPQQPEQSGEKDSGGLVAMLTSNCFNCHNFDTPSIGPAFAEIRKRYEPTPATMALLEARVREGSTGIWGEASMPTHTELSNEQIHHIIEWIMENAAMSNVRYYIGAKGSFQISGSSEYQAALLTASYRDHGVQSGRGRLLGEDTVVLRIR